MKETKISPLYAYGFIKSDLQTVAETWAGWYREKLGYSVQVRVLQGEFQEHLEMLKPYVKVAATKVLLVPSADNLWVGAFANDLPAPDHNHCSKVGQLLSADCLLIDDISEGSQSEMGMLLESRQFIYRYYEHGVEHRRVIVASQQGERRWVFDVQGDPLPFEDTSLYQQRSIKKRLTSDTLYLYMKALGIDMFAPGYFAGEGILIDFVNPRMK